MSILRLQGAHFFAYNLINVLKNCYRLAVISSRARGVFQRSTAVIYPILFQNMLRFRILFMRLLATALATRISDPQTKLRSCS